jgi:hypothetical protein
LCSARFRTPDDRAGKVVRCGRCKKPIRVPAAPAAPAEEEADEPSGGVVRRSRKTLWIVAAVAGGLSLFCLCAGVTGVGFLLWQMNEKPVWTGTAGDLFVASVRDPEDTDAKYRGKVVELTDVVVDVRTDPQGHSYLDLLHVFGDLQRPPRSEVLTAEEYADKLQMAGLGPESVAVVGLLSDWEARKAVALGQQKIIVRGRYKGRSAEGRLVIEGCSINP